MNRVVFSRLADGSYTIVDHNDERLALFAYIILDNKVREELKERLNHFEGFPLHKTLEYITTDKRTLKVQQQYDNILMLSLQDTSYDRKDLTTDIPNDVLSDIIDQWEDFVTQNAQEITFSREHDKDTIIVTKLS